MLHQCSQLIARDYAQAPGLRCPAGGVAALGARWLAHLLALLLSSLLLLFSSAKGLAAASLAGQGGSWRQRG